MRLVYRFEIKEREDIKRLCKISNNLYNQALYIFRETISNSNEWLFYSDLDKIMKSTENLEGDINYRLLKAQCSQQILKVLDQDIRSYLKSIKDYKKNPSKYKGKPELPSYKKRGGLFDLCYTNQCCSIKDKQIVLSKDIRIDIPQYESYGNDMEGFNQVRVIPSRKGFSIEIIYEKKETKKELNKEKYVSIDLGIDNLATLVSEDFVSIYSGRFIKSMNRKFNKTLSELKSIKDKQGIKKSTKRIKRLYDKRDRYLHDVFHKISKKIIDILIENNIGNLVVGYNRGWKQNVNMGKKNNQKFTYIPFARLISKLRYKCEMNGINFEINEESYTSKCDSLAFEKIGKHDSYLGRRSKRGLFKSSVGKLINADVNGAVNILRKVVGDSDVVHRIIDIGLLFNPVRIKSVF